ncbi:DUF86 domain-containing protein [bacterium]|nr:DUF86 domain-containing protein [bacterium]
MSKDLTLLADDALTRIDSIQADVEGISFDDFLRDTLVRDAVCYRLLVIGEVVKRIMELGSLSDNEEYWRSIIDFRNVIAHQYDEIELQMVWDIIQSELSGLRRQLLRLSEQAEE